MAAGDGEAGRWLARRARAVRGWLALAVGAGLAGGATVIAQAGLLAFIAHATIVAGRPPGELGPAFAALVAVVLARGAADWARQAAGTAAAARVRRRLRAELLEHVGRLGPVRLADVHSAGLASRLVERVDDLEGYYARFLPQAVLAFAVPLAIAAAVLAVDWLAAALLVLAAPPIPAFMALIGMGVERLDRRRFRTLERLAGHFLDRVRGLTTLHLFGATERAVGEVAAVSDDYRRHGMGTLRVAFLSSAVLEFFAAVAIALVAIYVGFGLLGYVAFGPAPALTLFSGLFVLLLAPEFFQPLRALAQHYHDRAAALAAAADLADLLERPAPAPAPPARRHAAPGAVALQGVHVAFPGRGPVLAGVDLALAPGERVVVVGPSGAGKSTLLHVVAGLVGVDAGEVRVDGRAAVVPGAVGWLGQRPFLARASVADNIRLGRPGASDAEVAAAARAADVDEFLGRLPAGLASRVGERGHGLSGGQAQRVALARAFLSEARVLCLDEPTASLDAASEARVLAALGRLAASGRTLLIASHHPRVRALADRVVRLEAGRLAAAGPGDG